MLRTCEKLWGRWIGLNMQGCWVGLNGKWLLGWLELACQTACACLFKVRPGVLSKTLSHIWGKLNLNLN